MTRLLSLFIVLALSSTAAAQAPGATPTATPAPVQQGEQKDAGIATMLSVGTTLGGLVVLGVGADDSESAAVVGLAALYFGPSTGQWYAGRIGGIGLASRALGAVLILKGISSLDGGYDCLGLTDAECRAAEQHWARDERNAELMMYGGLGLWVGSTIYDVVMARRATHAWNREHSVALTPALMPAAGGRAPGVTLQMKF